jgi:hypothetical protein
MLLRLRGKQLYHRTNVGDYGRLVLALKQASADTFRV